MGGRVRSPFTGLGRLWPVWLITVGGKGACVGGRMSGRPPLVWVGGKVSGPVWGQAVRRPAAFLYPEDAIGSAKTKGCRRGAGALAVKRRPRHPHTLTLSLASLVR